MSYFQEYTIKLFNEFYPKFKQLKFKSILHGDVYLNEINFNNFILSYSNMIDCLLKRYADDLKQSNRGNSSSRKLINLINLFKAFIQIEFASHNWKLIKLICIYCLFWSIAMYITSE